MTTNVHAAGGGEGESRAALGAVERLVEEVERLRRDEARAQELFDRLVPPPPRGPLVDRLAHQFAGHSEAGAALESVGLSCEGKRLRDVARDAAELIRSLRCKVLTLQVEVETHKRVAEDLRKSAPATIAGDWPATSSPVAPIGGYRSTVEQLQNAIGMLTTLHPTMELDVNDTVGMATKIVDKIRRERKASDVLSRAIFDIGRALEGDEFGGCGTVSGTVDAARLVLPKIRELRAQIGRALTRDCYVAKVEAITRAEAAEKERDELRKAAKPPLNPDAIKPYFLHTAYMPGEWSAKSDEYFVYTRIAPGLPWVEVSWRHGPGIANTKQTMRNGGEGKN